MEQDTIINKTNQNLSVLFGGLSLIPYSIFALLSAWFFWLGWLDWQTNGGPPFLGFITAVIISKAIQTGYYEPSFGFTFAAKWLAPEKLSSKWISLLFFGALLGGWYVDVVIHPPIRIVILIIALAMFYRGLSLDDVVFESYRYLHLSFGIFGIGFSFLPGVFDVVTNSMMFGIDGIFELIIIGLTGLILAIVEHQILVKVCTPINN